MFMALKMCLGEQSQAGVTVKKADVCTGLTVLTQGLVSAVSDFTGAP